MSDTEERLSPIAIPQKHDSFDAYFNKLGIRKDSAVLDYGAGTGAFLQRLQTRGFSNLFACDNHNEIFRLKGVECAYVNERTCKTSFDDKQFKVIIAIEVFEHLYNFHNFLDECHRILEDDGQLVISTPNIMSLKSRLKFLFKGVFYSFDRVDRNDASHHNTISAHLNALRIDHFEFFAFLHGFEVVNIEIDRVQNTSRWLYYLLYPFIRKHESSSAPNSKKSLLGRDLLVTLKKTRSSTKI